MSEVPARVRRYWRGLPLQFLFALLLPLALLLLVVAFGGALLHQEAMRTLVGERDQRAARAAAAAITEQLHHRAITVQSLALHAAQVPEPELALAGVALAEDYFDGGLALFEPGGRLLAASSPQAGRELTHLLAQAGPQPATWNNAAFSLILPEEGDPRPEQGDLLPEEGEPLLLVVSEAGGLVAAGAFAPAGLIRRALSPAFNAGDQAAAFVVAADGTLLYRLGRAPHSLSNLPQHPGVVSALRGESGTSYLRLNGSEHVLAFSPVQPVGWALVIEEPWHAVADPLLRLSEWAPLVLAPLLVLTLVGLGFGVRQVVQPLQQLAGQATAVGWGEYEAIEQPVGGIAEIQRLQAELIHMAHKVRAAQQSLRGYLGAVTAGQEEERRRLARELHDETIQALIALNQRLQLAALKAADSAPLEEMQEMVAASITGLRRQIRALRPIYLEDLGLVPSLQMLAREVAETGELEVAFRQGGQARRLPPDVELALYRITQEALSNVARHAHAAQATVRLDFTAEEVRLVISDEGRGFVVPESVALLAPQGHFGLLGIHERAELIGAGLSLASQPGAGTRLEVVLNS